MRKRLPSSIASIPKVTATPYRIKRGERGYTVWKFRGWSRGGWARMQLGLKCWDDAYLYVLIRHGLEDEVEPEPAKVPVIMYGFPIWDIYGGV